MLHVLSSCPCFMFMFHVRASCPCRMSRLHVYATCSCCMSMLQARAACPHGMPMLHVPVECPLNIFKLYGMFLLHFQYACSCYMSRVISMQHVHAACPNCISQLYANAASPCYMSMYTACPCNTYLLHDSAVLYVRAACPCQWCLSNAAWTYCMYLQHVLLHVLAACPYGVYVARL
jgi:hypothetical protein